MHNRHATAMLLSALLLGCGSSTTDAGVGGNGGGSGQCPSACDPFGSWELTYLKGDDLCAPSSETLVLEPDGSGVTASIVGVEQTPSSCGPTDDSTFSIAATASTDGCQLQVIQEKSWCMSGEGQCEDRSLDLQICGDTTSGTLAFSRCWCSGDGGPSGSADTFSVTGVRL